MKRLIPATLLALSISLPAFAGEFGDFEAKLRAAYGDYRTALFTTNMGKGPESKASLGKFAKAWSELSSEPAPPQYADDAAYAETLQAVTKITEAATAEVAAGELSKAHDTLEDIRGQIGDLHIRNDIYSFSDRMNAYHARMEEVIAMDPANSAGVHAQAAVLKYLLGDVVAHPPKEADASYKELLGTMEASVAKLEAASSSGDAAATKAAIGGLKAPYSKLFLKFG
ncbi:MULTISPECIES: hypothetical protein [Alphaproteobacteria]|uniref:DUF3829 domain-containing protein n=2 Tax=Alphaproteobacteria TaxID=28211 RepID=A0A512HI66_9HYPH|nr:MULTISPECIES: hypothetical protein [Alphaproteobacteria]GEO85144.1 hypothetical protein RNA01_20760 [Ciceribacter naphthalenivorans]GLR24522.1 hypothetical protein GCM10007920_43160 [Ciceribacter naphthalenivorans]GLT07378.1 hypothetical protein GCM10007926_43160 [Sphingomonas psychrolutea]